MELGWREPQGHLVTARESEDRGPRAGFQGESQFESDSLTAFWL